MQHTTTTTHSLTLLTELQTSACTRRRLVVLAWYPLFLYDWGEGGQAA